MSHAIRPSTHTPRQDRDVFDDLASHLEDVEVRERRRREAARQYILDYEAEHGEITQEEMDAVLPG